MNYMDYLLQVKIPRRYSVLGFFVLFFFAYVYLYLLGVGVFTNMAYCVHGAHNISQEHGPFVPSEGQTREIDCKKFNKMFPEFAKLQNVVPKPQLISGSQDGSGQQYYKVDKSIIASNNLSIRERCGLSLVSSEPKCFQVLGKFVKLVLPGEENPGKK